MKLIPIRKDNKTVYRCPCCDKEYDLPLCFGADVPAQYNLIRDEEKYDRIKIDKSWCVIDDERFFHRGRLTIPIIDNDEDLVYDIWATISQDDFCDRMDLWEDPERVKHAPYTGLLDSNILGYEEKVIGSEIVAIEQEPGYIPKIRLIDPNHPLTIDQQMGISLERAMEIVYNILHFQSKKVE